MSSSPSGGALKYENRSLSPAERGWNPTGIAGVPECFSNSYLDDIKPQSADVSQRSQAKLEGTACPTMMFSSPSGGTSIRKSALGSGAVLSESRSASPAERGWHPTGIAGLPKSFSSSYLRNVPLLEEERADSPDRRATVSEAMKRDLLSFTNPDKKEEPYVVVELCQEINGLQTKPGEERYYSQYVEIAQALGCYAIACKCLRVGPDELRGSECEVYLVTPGEQPEIRLVQSKKSSGRWQRPEYTAAKANDMLHQGSVRPCIAQFAGVDEERPSAARLGDKGPKLRMEKLKASTSPVRGRTPDLKPVKLHCDDSFKQAAEKYRRDEAELKLGQGPAGATDLERALQARLAEVQRELREASLRNDAERQAAQQRFEQSRRVQMAESEAEVAHYKEEAHSLIKSKLLQASQLQQTEEKLKHEQSRLSLMEGQSETMGRERKALQAQLAQTKSELREARSGAKSELRMLGTPAKDLEIELQQVRQHMQSELRESVARVEKERDAANVERDAAHVELREQAMRCREQAAENEQLRREAEQLRREVDDLSQKTAAQESLAQQTEQKLGEDKEKLRVPDATDPTREALEARLAQARSEQREVLSKVEAELVEERQRSQKSKDQLLELEKTTAQYKGEFQEMIHLKQMHESRLQQRDEQLRQSEARFVSMKEVAEATERENQTLQVRLVSAQSELREASSAMEAERLAAQRTAQQSRVQVAQFEGQAAHFKEELQGLTEMKQLQQRLLQQAKTELMSMQEQSEMAEKDRAALQSQLARARSELLESTASFENERVSAQQRTRQYKDLQARLEQAESDLTKAAATITDSERCTEKALQKSEGRMADLEAQSMQYKNQVEELVKARALQDSRLLEAEAKLKQEQARLASMQGQSEQERLLLQERLKQVQDELKTATKGVEAEQQAARHIAQQTRTEVENLESQAAQFKAQLDSFMQAKLLQDKELSRNAEELNQRQSSLEAAQQRAEAAERDREAARADLEKAQTELRKVQSEKRTTEEKLHQSKALVTAIETQTAQFKEQAGFPSPLVREREPPAVQEGKVAPAQREAAKVRILESAEEAEALNCGKCPFSPNANAADIAHVLKNSLSSMAQAVEGLKGRNLSESPEASSPVKAGSPLKPSPVVGVTITVVKPIQYEYPNSPEKNYDLRSGLHGVVTMVDEDGDLEVEWKGLGKRWLLKQDYASIKILKAAG